MIFSGPALSAPGFSALYCPMNFLAHFCVAARAEPLPAARPAYVAGTALPDLLPLAAPRARLRISGVASAPIHSSEDLALRDGVLAHLAADAAWHKTRAFAQAQAEASRRIEQAGFSQIRVRRFFLAHILVELALDAALLRRDPALGEDFYAAFSAANRQAVLGWAENAVARPLPALPMVLERFVASRYLMQYQTDEGVTTGLAHLCARARQDSFAGENYARLTKIVGETVQALASQADGLLGETQAGMA